MEERTNKTNTMLLTVIAIATLLVAVIGATFAYFTAQLSGQETNSTVVVNGATLTIAFADGDAGLIAPSDLVPTKAAGTPATYAPVATKTFNLTGNNNTTDMRMPYTLYLVVENNTFQLMNSKDNTTSLSYKLTSSGEGSTAQQTTYANIPCTTLDGTTGYTPGTNDEALQTSTLTSTATITNDAGTQTTLQKAITLGTGYFNPGATNAVHSYTLTIYFNDSDKNQDFDKGKSFSGHVVIDATAITTNS